MIRMQESPDSRDLNYGSTGGGMTFRLTAVATAGESESDIWLYALQQSQPYFNGFIRNDIKVRRGSGPNHFTVEIEYGTTGVGGGDQPLGGEGNDGGPPNQPTGPESPQAALKGGWSFSIRAPRLHLTQSRRTVVSLPRPGFWPGGVAPDYEGALGVTEDSKDVEGVDWPPEPAFTFTRTVARAVVTQEYLDALSSIAGRPNDYPFYFWQEGEVIFLSAEGQFTQGEGWSITFTFGVEKNDPNVFINDDFPGPFQTLPKKGFEYLWILYVRIDDTVAGKTVKVPAAAYVEEMDEPAPYEYLEIGT